MKDGDWFEDVTHRTGIDFVYRDGQEAGLYTLLESVGGGVALFDYDADGDLDIFIAGGGGLEVSEENGARRVTVTGRAPGLFRNLGDLRFEDVTEAAGLKDSGLYSHGCAVGDFDRDGRPDLFVSGWRGCRLYRNRGDGSFADVTATAGVSCPTWGLSAAWADFDRDGWLDLYIATYARWSPHPNERCLTAEGFRDVCGPSLFPGERDLLYRNRRDGTFEDVTSAAGLVPQNRGMGVVAADFDADGWIDIYVLNDVQENQLYFGNPQFPLTERAALSGAAVSMAGELEGSMGVALGDYDGDGRPDLWYTNFTWQDNTLLRNAGNRLFENRTETTGTLGKSRAWVKWGTAFADFDSDGWEDLVFVSGHTRYKMADAPYFQPSQVYRNDRGARFADVSAEAGAYFRGTHAARGLAVGDLDDDGAPDLVIVHQNEPVTILRNRRRAAAWVRLVLEGTRSNRDAVGAAVTVESHGRKVSRWNFGGGSYLSHSDRRILVPVDPAGPVDVSVDWPGHSREKFTGLQPNRTHRLVEGEGSAE